MLTPASTKKTLKALTLPAVVKRRLEALTLPVVMEKILKALTLPAVVVKKPWMLTLFPRLLAGILALLSKPARSGPRMLVQSIHSKELEKACRTEKTLMIEVIRSRGSTNLLRTASDAVLIVGSGRLLIGAVRDSPPYQRLGTEF